MKLTAVALATIALAGPANASTFAPRDAAFALYGSLTVTLHHIEGGCYFKMIGQTRGAEGSITGVTLSGTGPFNCFELSAFGLPWKMKTPGPQSAVIYGVKLGGSKARCKTTMQPVFLNTGSKGLWSFTPGARHDDCGLYGTLKSTPRIHIKP